MTTIVPTGASELPPLGKLRATEPLTVLATPSKKLGSGADPGSVPIRATPFRWCDPSTIPVRQWLYGRHAIRRFVSLTVAAGGTGKTALTIAEAISLITGRDYLKNDVSASGRAWYVGLEDPMEEYQRRVAAISLHYGIKQTELNGGLFLDSGRDQKFIIASEERNGLQLHWPVVEQIIENIVANDIALVIVDPFVACHTVTEADNTKIAAVAAAWARIADETGAAVELVHHIRKSNGGQEPTADDARGASALVNAARSVRMLAPMSKEDAGKAKVDEDNRRRFFQVAVGKANLILPSDRAIWRQLVSVSLGNGNGGPDDIVGVATCWDWPSALDGLTVADLEAVRRRVGESNTAWREDMRSTEWVGLAIADVLKLDPTAKGDRSRIQGMQDIWTKNGAFNIVTKPDQQRKLRRFVEVGGWAEEEARRGNDAPLKP